MILLLERLRVAMLAMRCKEARALPPKVGWALLKSLSTVRPTRSGTGTLFYVNSPPVESPAFRRYLQGIKRMAAGANVPLTVHVSVTDRCGYRCRRCSNGFMRGGACHHPSTADLRGLLRALKAAGTVSVGFTGGEPMLRDDLCVLVEESRPEIAPLLFTSGQKVDAQAARDLKSAGLAMAAVSLDSHDEAIHDAIRGSSGACRQAIQAIRCFLEAGVYTAAQMVAEPATLAGSEALDAYVRFCGKLGVHEIVLLDPMSRDGASARDLEGPEIRTRLAALHRRSIRSRTMPKVTAAAYLESADCLGCIAGYGLLYVSAAGELMPCDFAPVSFGNVFEEGFDAVFRRVAAVIKCPRRDCIGARLMDQAGLASRVFPVRWDSAREALAAGMRNGPGAMMRAFCPGPPP